MEGLPTTLEHIVCFHVTLYQGVLDSHDGGIKIDYKSLNYLFVYYVPRV